MINLDKFRNLIEDSDDMPDDELKKIRDTQYGLAGLLYNIFNYQKQIFLQKQARLIKITCNIEIKINQVCVKVV